MSDTSQSIPSSLVALVGSRICHDLVSPVGAILNGVELLEMSGQGETPEIALIRESVENANARIRFFRIAFGAASKEQRIGAPEASETLAILEKSGRLKYRWQSEADLSREEVRLIFLLLLCFESAMPLGGSVSVVQRDGGWRIEAEAKKLKYDTALWSSLAAPKGIMDIPASQVQFALLPGLIRESGRRLHLEHTETRIRALL
ncbi:histidine phosphotransferase family protein [Aestuariibius insulae]|uniref:histidine phosphotransferase family protein n=1 Tax=Aestuariibius insulae TaxID=2058287 RepID=UPI00345E7886